MGNSVPSRLREWLYEDRSLTARLKHLCPGKFSLRLLDQRLERPMQDERSCLQLPSGRSALIRQVQLLCDNTPLVFARSVIPLTTLKGTQRQLAHLGTRPLADMLFASRTMQRSTMEFVRLRAGHTLNARAVDNLGNYPGEIWGRRSRFCLNNKPLLVMEFFSPRLAVVTEN